MKKKTSLSTIITFILLFMVSSSVTLTAQKVSPAIDFSGYKMLKVKPSEADPSVKKWDSAHVVYYDSAIKNNKVLLWLTGTNGSTDHFPQAFLKTALDQGYKVIALSFFSKPGVSQICKDDYLSKNVNCAAEFRRKRIYGDNVFLPIPDQYQDAIIPRLTKLLQYLSKNDKEDVWSQYLNQGTGKPVWSKIAIAGQSQGGGMAEFIAQHESVARIISFSGGWDYSDSEKKKIAGWYSQKLMTSPQNVFATYHVKEAAAAQLEEICKTLHIPSENVFALDEPLKMQKKGPNPYHVEGVSNTVYKPIWIKMLGSGR
ncbi:BPSS1187 family protein [Chryseobacterium sp. CBSDS_008]|uniref:BPSS1187 family protein n=1 Tax=Chryseobacterium sp. CBSDS_008 TaxID=3415265 RepID=UPI003CF5AD71